MHRDITKFSSQTKTLETILDNIREHLPLGAIPHPEIEILLQQVEKRLLDSILCSPPATTKRLRILGYKLPCYFRLLLSTWNTVKEQLRDT